MTAASCYWYARGYYDGRSEGVRDDNVTEYPDADRQAYGDGYDRGVTDYCEYDDPTPLEDTAR